MSFGIKYRYLLDMQMAQSIFALQNIENTEPMAFHY